MSGSFFVWPGTAIAIGLLLFIVLGQAGRIRNLSRRVERLERASYGMLPDIPSSGSADAGEPAPSLMELTDEQNNRLRALLIQKKKIEAIKELREWQRLGLKEAKETVDTLHLQMKARGEL